MSQLSSNDVVYLLTLQDASLGEMATRCLEIDHELKIKIDQGFVVPMPTCASQPFSVTQIACHKRH